MMAGVFESLQGHLSLKLEVVEADFAHINSKHGHKSVQHCLVYAYETHILGSGTDSASGRRCHL